MNGTAVGLLIGFAYGAVLGVYAYRWYQRERERQNWRFERLEGRLDALHERMPAAEAVAA